MAQFHPDHSTSSLNELRNFSSVFKIMYDFPMALKPGD